MYVFENKKEKKKIEIGETFLSIKKMQFFQTFLREMWKKGVTKKCLHHSGFHFFLFQSANTLQFFLLTITLHSYFFSGKKKCKN